jgi:hypothetical protein
LFALEGGAALDTFPCVPYGQLLSASGGTIYPKLNAGYLSGTGLQVSRQIYVSTNGSFTRYLEVLTNPSSSVAVTVRVRISGAMASGTPTLTQPPGSNFNMYAVFNDGGAGLGLVFRGTGSNLTNATPNVVSGRRTYSYDWVVTVQPRQTRRLNLASGLAALSIPEAVAGITPTEKSSVVNFHIP